MDTIKIGSKGSQVKFLQIMLDVTPADGDFGHKTELAVKAFQQKNGLAADGIVGAKTWGLITARNEGKSDKKVTGCTYMPLERYYSHAEGRDIDYIVIHYTAGSTSKKGQARNVRNYHNKKKDSGKASADFIVDDEEIVQCNPDPWNNYCWSVGDSKKEGYGARMWGAATNRNTINIEMCSTLEKGWSSKYANHQGWSFTDAVIDRTETLVKTLMHKYDVPVERVIRHYDVTGKMCPGILGWNFEKIRDNNGNKTSLINNDDRWLAFKRRLM